LNRAFGIGSHSVQVQQFWGFLMLICVLRLLVEWRVRWRNPLGLLTLAVAATGFIGAAAGPAPGSSVKQWLWVTLSLLCLPLGVAAASRLGIDRIASAMLVAAVLTLVLVAVNPYGHTASIPVPVSTAAGGGSHVKYVSQVSANYVSIHTLAFAADALLVWVGLYALDAGSLPRRVLSAVVAVGLGVVVVLSTSRTGQLGLLIAAAGLVVAAYIRYRDRLGRRGLAIAGVVLALLVAAPLASSNVRTRWSEAPHELRTRGLAWVGSGRGYLWSQAFKDWEHARPLNELVGSGYYSDVNLTRERIGTGFAAHSDVIELLVSVGVVGLALYAGLVGYVGVLLLRARSSLVAHASAWFWVLGIAAAGAFLTLSVLTGFIRYTSSSAPGLLFLGYALGVAASYRPRATALPVSAARGR
jgi:hypothetical protein